MKEDWFPPVADRGKDGRFLVETGSRVTPEIELARWRACDEKWLLIGNSEYHSGEWLDLDEKGFRCIGPVTSFDAIESLRKEKDALAKILFNVTEQAAHYLCERDALQMRVEMLVRVLDAARTELEEYEDALSGECYNNTEINAAIATVSTATTGTQDD